MSPYGILLAAALVQTSGEPLRFFGDRIAAVPVSIHSPGEGTAIRADLVQLTSGLAARAAGEIDVPPGARELAVSLPAVTRQTDFELRFRWRDRDHPAWQPAGRIALRVYPADLLAPLRAWAQSHPLRAEDERMAEFLRSRGIPLAGRDGPREVTLYTGGSALQKLRGETAVLVTERETEIPHLVVDRTGPGVRVRVEARLMDRLADDPLAQKILMEAFRLLQETKEGMP
jgi:hypothetical protein